MGAVMVMLQSVPITTNIASLNLFIATVYSIKHYVIEFVSDLRKVCGYLRVLPVSYTNKTYRYAITGILLKVAYNTITPPPPQMKASCECTYVLWVECHNLCTFFCTCVLFLECHIHCVLLQFF